MTDAEQGSRGVFDLERLRTLIELMREHEVAEIDLREGEQQIRIARSGPGVASVSIADASRGAAGHSPIHAAQATAAAQVAPTAADGPNIVIIRSPMVGTFYSRPNPNAEPFIKIGDHVEPNSTVCIVEAMKMFNEIPAEVRGRIVAVLVDDEEPVDHGKPLFKVDTNG